MNIFITGKPGVGKTTLIKELAETLSGKAEGFYTEEVRKEGVRTGFSVKTLDGKIGTLAGIDVKSPYRVSKYNVDLEDFESVALPAVELALANSRTVIIDEIGPMELYSERFKEVVVKALDSQSRVVATIKMKGLSFVDKLKSRDDVVLYTLTYNNRKEILRNILDKLAEGGS